MNEIDQNTVLISGGAGSMGQLVSNYINSRDDFTLTAIHDPNYKGQEYKNYKDLMNVEEDIVLEFSPASIINENLDTLLKSNADLIIGSSGISSDMLSKLKTVTDKKIIVIPNFSIGAAYQKLFSLALSDNFDSVNITEKHHSKKEDAPSGTAIDIANSLPLELSSHDKEGDFYQVNNLNNKIIYSLRDVKFLAEQEVDFMNAYESFNLSHKVNDRKAYLFGLKVVLDLYNELDGFNLGLENLIAKKINI
tara:strand:+ start:5833 stop:6582 length:750 start_codon:yes stop_codon:yes gene_type:complete